MLAGYEADERLAVFLVVPQAEVMAELEDSLLGWAALLRSGDLRLESVLHGYSFGEVLISWLRAHGGVYRFNDAVESHAVAHGRGSVNRVRAQGLV